MRHALALIRERLPDLEVDGEMHADAALSEAIRDRVMPDSTLSGVANLLVMPNLDSANIAFNLVKAAGRRPAGWAITAGHVHARACSGYRVSLPRGIVNMTALAVVEAGKGGK